MRRWPAVVVLGVLVLAGCSSGGAGPAAPGSAPDVAGSSCPQMVSDNAGRNLRFGVGGATNLAGIVAGRGATGIVLAHAEDADVCSWADEFHELVTHGYRALAFDSQGFGASQSRSDTTFDDDVVAAAGALRADGASRIVLFGASMGGTFCLAAATRIQPPVTAVISSSAPTVYEGVDAADAVPRLTMPVLFVAASGDGLSSAAARSMYAAAKASRARRIKVSAGRQHGVLLVTPGGDAQVRAAVTAFLLSYAPRG